MLMPRLPVTLAICLVLAAWPAPAVASQTDEPADPAPALPTPDDADAPADAPDTDSEPAGPGSDLTPFPEVVVSGDGPVPMVLLPGVPTDWTLWEGFMERNSERYTMHAVTLPGMRGTQAPPEYERLGGTPWFTNALRATIDLIETRDLDDPVVVGHGFGGMIAYELAVQRPDLIRGAVSVEGLPAVPLAGRQLRPENRPDFALKVARYILQPDQEAWEDGMMRKIENWLPNDPDAVEHLERIVEQTDARTVGFYQFEVMLLDMRESLPDIIDPFLVIGAVYEGGPNQIRRESLLNGWQTALAGAPNNLTFVPFEDARHFIPLEHPEALDRAIDAFVRGERRIPGTED